MKKSNINSLDNIQAEIAKNVQDFMDNPCPSCGGKEVFEDQTEVEGQLTLYDIQVEASEGV